MVLILLFSLFGNSVRFFTADLITELISALMFCTTEYTVDLKIFLEGEVLVKEGAKVSFDTL